MSTFLHNTLWLLFIFVVFWLIPNLVGWITIRTMSADGPYPFNWRIFLGPWSYLKWHDARRNGKE